MFSSKVFRQYLILFVGVALLACLLAGFLLLHLSSREMENAARLELEKRWNTAVDDFSTQMKRLDELALRMSFEYNVSPQLVRRGAVKELELLELLKKYEDTSLWNERIILYYPQNDALFTSKAKYRSHYFSTYLIGAQNPEALMNQIENAAWGEWIAANNVSSFLVFPLRYQTTGERMYCLFQVEHSSLQEQAAFVSALDSSLTLQGEAQPSKSLLVSSNDVFSLWVNDGESFRLQRQSLISLATAMIVLLSIVFIGVAVVMAYLCYSPIRQMTARFLSGQPMSGNELESLSHTLDKALNDRQYSQRLLVEQIRRMDEQKESFRRQLLLLMLSGHASGDGLAEAGLLLPGPFYTLIAIEAQENVPFDQLKQLVEELSDESISFCAVDTGSGTVALCSLQDQMLLMDALDMLGAAGEAAGLQLTVRAGQICTSLSQLSAVLDSLRAGEDAQSGDPVTPRWYDNGSLSMILSAIRQGRVQPARDQLRVLIRSIRSMPEALGRCAVIDVFNRLVQCALDARLPVPGELGAQLLEASDEEEILSLFDRAIDKMTHTQSAPATTDTTAASLVQYVDEHACEISFTISCLSDLFGLSTKYIARQIREHTGMPYRNYIIHLRIKEACRLLRSTDTPVCNIHEMVGYSSASHFVKVFRTVTGMTPSAYRSDGYMLSPESLRMDALDDVGE